MKNWTRGWIITEIICAIVAVVVSVWIGFGVGNGDWLNKPEKVTRYSQTTDATTADEERLATAAAVINSRVKELRDAFSQQVNIDDLRLLREIHDAEEKVLLERMARIKKVEVR